MKIERYDLRDDGLVPNNPSLPLTVYRSAIDASAPGAEQRFISRFGENDWSGAWINGIYRYHHYHATAHEVLGIAAGEARVQFGGPNGPIVAVTAGDAVMIPAGVGHCCKSASADLSVVGAYPGGADYDTQQATPEARIKSLPLIAAVPPPKRDPVLSDPRSS